LAGIQFFSLDPRQTHSGMTTFDNMLNSYNKTPFLVPRPSSRVPRDFLFLATPALAC